MDEEITPKLDRLRKERALYNELQKVKTEYERIQHFCLAYQYAQLRVQLASHIPPLLSANRSAARSSSRVAAAPPLRRSSWPVRVLPRPLPRWRTLRATLTSHQIKLDTSQTDLNGKTKRIAQLQEEIAAIHSELKVSAGELQRVRQQRQKVR